MNEQAKLIEDEIFAIRKKTLDELEDLLTILLEKVQQLDNIIDEIKNAKTKKEIRKCNVIINSYVAQLSVLKERRRTINRYLIEEQRLEKELAKLHQ